MNANRDYYWLDGSAYCPDCVECATPAIDAADPNVTRGPATAGCRCCHDENETPAMLVHQFAGYHYTDASYRRRLNHVNFCDLWPVIDADGLLTGSVVGSEEGFANVNDEAMISIDDARAGGWTIVDGYAKKPASA